MGEMVVVVVEVVEGENGLVVEVVVVVVVVELVVGENVLVVLVVVVVEWWWGRMCWSWW